MEREEGRKSGQLEAITGVQDRRWQLAYTRHRRKRFGVIWEDLIDFCIKGGSGIVGWLSGLQLGLFAGMGTAGRWALSGPAGLEVPAKAGLLEGLGLVWVSGAPWRF